MRNFLFVIFLAIGLSGCASLPDPGPSQDPVPLPAGEGKAGAREAQEPGIVPDPDPDPSLSKLLKAIRESSREAQAAYEAGDDSTAKRLFENCLRLILDAEFDLSTTPTLRTAFEEVVRIINATDLTFFPDQAPPAEAEEAAVHQELGRIEPTITPEEAARDREKIAPIAEEITYDIPITLNDKVLSWIEVYQGKLRKEFEVGLRNSGRFLPMIQKVFRDEGLPLDLVFMAHVESSYKPKAYSRARAMGIWQFILSTGRMYGLRRNDWVDERADPEKATRAAARHLKDLHEVFGDWYLAMAAYNAGEGRIRHAIRRTRSRDFWVLARSRYIRRETKNYVPAILATILISKDPESYGFQVETDPPWKYEHAEVETMTDLRVIAECAGRSLEEIRGLNPELRWMTTPPNISPFSIRLPVGTRETFRKNYSKLPPEERVLWVRHRVRRGDSLSRIASRYGTTIPAIQSANGIRNRHRIRQGSVLLIPVGPRARRTSGYRSTASRRYEGGQRIRHLVRRGETLSRIALRYRTDVESLCAWNQLNLNSVIYAGERLTVYYGRKAEEIGVASRSTPPPGNSKGKKVIHRVRRGDTLYGIARRYRTTLQNLCRWNGINRREFIHPGDTLIVYTKR